VLFEPPPPPKPPPKARSEEEEPKGERGHGQGKKKELPSTSRLFEALGVKKSSSDPHRIKDIV